LAIFLGRTVRFFLLGILVLKFGPGIVHTSLIFFSHHFHWLIIAAVLGLGLWYFLRRRKRAASVARPA